MGRIVKAGKVNQAGARASTASTLSAARKDLALAEVTSLLVSARAAANAELVAAKDGALLLARKMAERIVGRAVELEPVVMGEIVARALAAARTRPGAVVLRVHPEDLEAVERTRPDWRRKLAVAADVRVIADASVGRNGCVVDTPVGRLDARLQSQLHALENALRGSARIRT
jgi:flagellar assembly protein FliH